MERVVLVALELQVLVEPVVPVGPAPGVQVIGRPVGERQLGAGHGGVALQERELEMGRLRPEDRPLAAPPGEVVHDPDRVLHPGVDPLDDLGLLLAPPFAGALVPEATGRDREAAVEHAHVDGARVEVEPDRRQLDHRAVGGVDAGRLDVDHDVIRGHRCTVPVLSRSLISWSGGSCGSPRRGPRTIGQAPRFSRRTGTCRRPR